MTTPPDLLPGIRWWRVLGGGFIKSAAAKGAAREMATPLEAVRG